MGSWHSYIRQHCAELNENEAIIPVRELPIGEADSIGEILKNGARYNVTMERFKISGANYDRCYEYASMLIEQFNIQQIGSIKAIMNGFLNKNISEIFEIVERVVTNDNSSLWVCAAAHNKSGKLDFMMACLKGELTKVEITAHLINTHMIGYSKSKQDYCYSL